MAELAVLFFSVFIWLRLTVWVWRALMGAASL